VNHFFVFSVVNTSLLYRTLATLFGIGRFPYAPGTLASAIAIPLAWFLAGFTERPPLIVATVVVAAIGVAASDRYVRATGLKDPSACVIDELAGQWAACCFAPRTVLAYGLCFLLFRIFDIVKPWPISAAESLPGGFGVMADDLLAGILAGGIVLLLFAWRVI
jgi:phosphatidylglycerophosphatase A